MQTEMLISLAAAPCGDSWQSVIGTSVEIEKIERGIVSEADRETKRREAQHYKRSSFSEGGRFCLFLYIMTPQECIKKFVTEHPIEAATLLGGITVTAAPVVVAAPFLGGLGFGAAGVAQGSLAAAIQASFGPIAAKSLFAVLQSAGAGGMGMAAVKTAIQAAGGAMTAGPVHTLLQCLSSNATAT
ncbi:uncharacterized protein Triagg1_9828 [Trichoderma aggressivum f. europaeum]|uniref:Uncharacterized protein n=1 Tax=Trichoderma aggressivum f. europaeum TaxID=173218 RepID=A0AAE1IY27_9HYPO|nr:hypothetical protein Triagg1_9828 [Trichoderma aggressivum f. europaeum]